MKHGRPLRFLSVVVIGWTSLRVAMLWPSIDSPAGLIRALAPIASAAPESAPAHPARAMGMVAAAATTVRARPRPVSTDDGAAVVGNPVAISLALAALVSFGPSLTLEEAPAKTAQATLPPPVPPAPIATGSSRLSGSAWLITRDGGMGSALGGSQLGGSQAGIRLAYAIGRARRLAAVARVATPLEDRGREAALGLEWRASNAIRLVIEQRFAFDRGGRGGPTVGVIGGIGPKPIGAGFSLEAYGQAGVIARGGVEGYGDGAVRGYRPIARIAASTIDLGAGAWGGAQRGASRLDVGPSVGASVPVGSRRARLTLDWRQRVAGDARPRSGPALSIGTDF